MARRTRGARAVWLVAGAATMLAGQACAGEGSGGTGSEPVATSSPRSTPPRWPAMRMAGAMIRDAVRNGRLELEDGDIQELQRGLIAVADQPGQPWFAEGSHGTAEQRNEAFSLDTTARWMRASSDM